MTLASRLKEARNDAGMTQSQLAEETGISQQMITKLESGKTAQTSFILALAQALRVSPTWLQDGTGQKHGQTDFSQDTMECAEIIQMLLPSQRTSVKEMLRQLAVPAASNAKVEARMPITKEKKRRRDKSDA